MQKILGKISQWLADENVIEQKDKGLYEYALKSVLITICPIANRQSYRHDKRSGTSYYTIYDNPQIQRRLSHKEYMDMPDSIMRTYSRIYIFVPIYR